jgi:hypothetical protein
MKGYKMEFELTICKKQVVDLSEEECEAILVKTLKNDYYNIFHDLDADACAAVKEVYYIYTGQTLV